MDHVTARAPAPGALRMRLLFWIQCIIGLIPLLLLPAVWRMRPIWTVDQRSLAILALITAAYLVAIWILLRGDRRGRLATGQQVLLVCGTAFVPVLLAVPLYHPGFSRFAVLTSPFLALALLWFAFCIHRWDRVRLTAVAVVALIALGLAFIVLGLAAASREVFRKTSRRDRALPTDPEAWEKLLRAVTELVKVAPQWFLLTLVGAALVGVGAYLL